MSVPDEVRLSLRSKLWGIADQIGWLNMTTVAKAQQYKVWTADPTIGGVLIRYLDKAQVRVYIKDTVMDHYGRDRLADKDRPLALLGLDKDEKESKTYEKPHGRLLASKKVICWGRADDWKTILMATHERAFIDRAEPFAVVLMFSKARYHDDVSHAVVEDASRKLGIKVLKWLD